MRTIRVLASLGMLCGALSACGGAVTGPAASGASSSAPNAEQQAGDGGVGGGTTK